MQNAPRHIIAATLGALALAAAGAANAQQSDMSFFVTSASLGKGADLGGLEGADKHCQSLAAAAGAGGTIPLMAGRIDAFYGKRPNLKEFAPDGIMGEMRRLHYDTANATSAPTMAALLKLVPPTQVTFGSDYPYFPLSQFEDLAKLGLTAEQIQGIGSGNITRLIPHLKSA